MITHDTKASLDATLSKRKKVVFVLATLFLGFLIVEIGIRIVQIWIPGREYDELKARETLAPYRGASWAHPYYEEIRAMKPGLDPLVGWRPKEFHGTYVNVDDDGTRETWSPATSSEEAVEIFMFGGSALWGAGARDEHTIPSYVSKLLNSNSKNLSYRVRNYGQSGYVLIQEIAKLTLLLNKGERPDYVVFYHGANDVSYAYESGIAGPRGGAELIRAQFEERLEATASGKIQEAVKNFLKNYCRSCRVAFNAVRSIWPTFLNPYSVAGRDLNERELTKLAQEIALQYKNNSIDFLHRVSRAFNFKLLLFWQPNIFTEADLVGEEKVLQRIDPHISDQKLAFLHREVAGELGTDEEKHFYNLSDVLTGRTKEYYIDYAHVSEDGNKLVAEKIVKIFRIPYQQ